MKRVDLVTDCLTGDVFTELGLNEHTQDLYDKHELQDAKSDFSKRQDDPLSYCYDRQSGSTSLVISFSDLSA